MAEKIVVLQSSQFETSFWAPDPESDAFRPVEQINALTPCGMLLASLGSYTAMVLHTYAQHHGLDLQDVELRLQYGRPFTEDWENSGEHGRHQEPIEEEIVLYGGLSSAEHDKLLDIAHQCSIHKILNSEVEVKSLLAQDLQ